MIVAELIAVGSELLVGGRAESNSLFLADALSAMGLSVKYKTVVGDNVDDINRVLAGAVQRADVVIMTGGLGPTVDDVTREAVAKASGQPLRQSKVAKEQVLARFAARGRTPAPVQMCQARIPAGATVLPNPNGTAPGFFLEIRRSLVFVLPGVPSEAQTMLTASVCPILEKTLPLPFTLDRRVLRVIGLTEAEVDARIRPVCVKFKDVTVGILASPLGVTVSLSQLLTRTGLVFTRAGKRQENLLDRLICKMQDLLGQHVYATENLEMEEVVGRLLSASGLTLALAESCTGGLIGHRLTQVPGSSTYFDCSVVCYSNRAKIDWLHVPDELFPKYGAVSAEVARAMAQGVRQRTGADIGLSVTGIAGPGGETKDKPVGLVYVGLDGQGDYSVKQFQFHGDRPTIKLRASQCALDMLRRWLVTRPVKGGG